MPSQQNTRDLQKRAVWPWVSLLLSVHLFLTGYLATKWSPNVDEPAHLAAGMAVWQYGAFEIYCVNPPLMRAVATLPILFMRHERDWGSIESDASGAIRTGARHDRQEFELGRQFVESHPDSWERLLIAGRWAILPFSIVGAWFCYRWAAELFGQRSGLVALTLWCFSPNILTWSAVLCTDGIVAATGVAAGYFFWRWLKEPNWRRVPAAGVWLGLAQLSKMTCVVLFPAWLALWCVFGRATSESAVSRRRSFPQLLVILTLALYVLNLGYAFDGSLAPLGNYTFHSRLLAGENGGDIEHASFNRFAGSWVGAVPIPLPKCYIIGMDIQRVDFESGMSSYLLGEWSERGWWYYYLVGLALKVPLGTWGLALVAGLTLIAAARSSQGNGGLTSVPGKPGWALALDQAVL